MTARSIIPMNPLPATLINAPLQIAQFFTGEFLQFALLFFVLAVIAYAVGARGIAGVTMQIAKILIAVFLILALVSLLL